MTETRSVHGRFKRSSAVGTEYIYSQTLARFRKAAAASRRTARLIPDIQLASELPSPTATIDNAEWYIVKGAAWCTILQPDAPDRGAVRAAICLLRDGISGVVAAG